MFIKNLSHKADEEDLEKVFNAVLPDVKILSIRIPRKDDGMSKGVAFIDLETKEMAEKSQKLTNHNVKG